MSLRRCPKCGRMGLEDRDRNCLWSDCNYIDDSLEADVLDVIETLRGLETLAIHPQISQLYKKARLVLHQAILWVKNKSGRENYCLTAFILLAVLKIIKKLLYQQIFLSHNL